MSSATSMTEIEFGELPPGRSPRAKWAGIVEQLKERPQEWAQVETFKQQSSASTVASQLKKGLLGGAGAGEIEAVSRGNAVWARFVGVSAN